MVEYSADLAHLVERDLAKVEVAGSSPVIRSNGHSVVTRLQKAVSVICRRHSQAVRQRSAKPLFPSSILGGASNKEATFGKQKLLLFYPSRQAWYIITEGACSCGLIRYNTYGLG